MRRVLIDAGKEKGRLDKFWQAAGCDLLWNTILEGKCDDFLGRIKKDGTIKYIRNHYIISDEIDVDSRKLGLGVFKNGKYDFTRLKKAIDKILDCGMKPIIECDYIPEGYSVFTDHDWHSWPRDYEIWSGVVNTLVKYLTEAYGESEVKTWPFEVWNEPDRWDRSNLDKFYRLYDTFVHAVKSVSKDYKTGGPASYSTFIDGFLNHCCNGKNHITGEKGTEIDFISHHIYGAKIRGNGESLVKPRVQDIIRELIFLKFNVLDRYPSLKRCDFYLDEWGIYGDFRRSSREFPQLEVRDSEYSALFMIKLVDNLLSLKDYYNFCPAVMLYWGFAFETRNSLFNGNRSLVTRYEIPKPIYQAYRMLNLMEGTRVLITDENGGIEGNGIASRSEKSLMLLIYNFNENEIGSSEDVNIVIDNMAENSGTVKYTKYEISPVCSNSYRMWKEMGSPVEPDELQVKKLRNDSGLKCVSEGIIKTAGNQIFHDVCLMPRSACLFVYEVVGGQV